jgi:hypothetical protein
MIAMRHSTLMSCLCLCLCVAMLFSACLTEQINLCDQANPPWECTCPDAQEQLRKFDGYDPRCEVCQDSPDNPMCKENPLPIDAGKDAGATSDAGRVQGDTGIEDAGPDADAGPWECPERCATPTANCDVAAQSCAACTEDGHCEVGDAMYCVDHSCVECRPGAVTDCAASSVGPVCLAGACKQCADHPDCVDLSKAQCDGNHACVPCDDDVQCAGRMDDEGDVLAQCVDGECVECESEADCATNEVCDDDACVDCVLSSDCENPTAARCASDSTCNACEDDADCMHFSDTKACAKAGPRMGQCVECTLEREDLCNGKVCVPTTETCSPSLNVDDLDDCDACQFDSQCESGGLALDQRTHRCVPLQWQGAFRNNYCLKISNGANCTKPWSTEVVGLGSTSGAGAADYCGIEQSLTTCEAVQAFGIDCGTVACPAGGQCETVGATPSTCTYPCSDTVQCSGSRVCDAPSQAYCH